ncbi:MAG TPA: HAD family phosphatase [Flavisolibacter sp.]
MYKAFLFDLNGTIIDDMQYHITAWHRILNSLGADVSLQRTKEECYGKNGELLERIFPGVYTQAEKDRLSIEKEKAYQKEFKPLLQFIDGFEPFLQKIHGQGIKTAIGSAAITFNIDFVLDGLNIRHLMDAIVSADDVAHSKPHPETFLKCAEALGISPGDCLVFEDAPKGVEAAQNAGMDCIVITTMHSPEEFSSYKNIIGFIPDYKDHQLRNLIWQKE